MPITKVQTSAPVQSSSSTFGATITPGNGVVVMVENNAIGGTIVSIKDDQGNIYTPGPTDTNVVQASIYYLFNIQNAPKTILATTSGATQVALVATEIAPSPGFMLVADGPGTHNSGGTGAPSPGSMATNGLDYIAACMASASTAVPPSLPAGFTSLLSVSNVVPTAQACDQIGSGTFNPTWQNFGTNWAAAMLGIMQVPNSTGGGSNQALPGPTRGLTPGAISTPKMAFNVKFAGIPFLLDEGVHVPMPSQSQAIKRQQSYADVVDEILRLLPFSYLQDVAATPTLGHNLDSIANLNREAPPEVRINDWYYPVSASRWSMWRGLMTSSMVKELEGITEPQTFLFEAQPIGPGNQDNGFSISTSMFVLPPRPLAEHGGGMDGLFLVTLVDERYWWQYNSVSLHVQPGNTWDFLIQQLALALGVTISYTPISTNYTGPEPDSQLWTNFEGSGSLLDAVAYCIGRNVVRNYDGTYVLMKPTESAKVVSVNRGKAETVARLAGGDIFNSGSQQLKAGDLQANRNMSLPSSVIVTFPKYVYGDDPVPHFLNARYANQRQSSWLEDSYGDVYPVAIQIASVLPGYAGVPNVSQSIRSTAKALYGSEALAFTAPGNLAGLTSLAVQIATDYYAYQSMASLDEVYPGTVEWTPEGFHDIVWTYSARARIAGTRVMRVEWNAVVGDMQQTTPALPGFTSAPRGVGGPSVAQTVRDQTQYVSGLVTAQLTATLVSGDASNVFLFGADNLPTQNRWRGKIGNEVIEFEGTSGGTTVGIVFRGVDGTIQDTHGALAQVTQLLPNVNYGTNLITLEKGQFVYAAEWTSGGIQGVNIVPQLQSIEALAGNGVIVNPGVTLYSGQLHIFDFVRNVWNPNEYVWLLERTNKSILSGTRYGAQLLGTGASGLQPAPIYGTNEFGTGGGQGFRCTGVISTKTYVVDIQCTGNILTVQRQTEVLRYNTAGCVVSDLSSIFVHGAGCCRCDAVQAWYCLIPVAGGPQTCRFGTPPFAGFNIVSGPYQQQQDCLNNCQNPPLYTCQWWCVGTAIDQPCSYTVMGTLNWSNPNNDFPDLDLYIKNVTDNAVCYFGNSPAGGLSLNEDAWPVCFQTPPPPEIITGTFTASKTFSAWFNQYSNCAEQLNPLVDKVVVTNTGTTNISVGAGQVGGQILAPGQSTTISPLAYAGYGTGDQSNFAGGTPITVLCNGGGGGNVQLGCVNAVLVTAALLPLLAGLGIVANIGDLVQCDQFGNLINAVIPASAIQSGPFPTQVNCQAGCTQAGCYYCVYWTDMAVGTQVCVPCTAICGDLTPGSQPICCNAKPGDVIFRCGDNVPGAILSGPYPTCPAACPGGGGIGTGCCPNPIPNVLRYTIQFLQCPGSLPLTGVLVFNQIPFTTPDGAQAAGAWYFPSPFVISNELVLGCFALLGGGVEWRLYVQEAIGICFCSFVSNATVISCDPFELVFDNACIKITITE